MTASATNSNRPDTAPAGDMPNAGMSNAENAWSSREILEAMPASAPIAIVMVDTNGLILYANSKLEEMFGYASDELLGNAIEILIPDRFRRDHVGHRYRSFPTIAYSGPTLVFAYTYSQGYRRRELSHCTRKTVCIGQYGGRVQYDWQVA